MTRISYHLLVLVACLFWVACASSNEGQDRTDTEVPMEELEQMAADRYGTEAAITYIPNEAVTHILVLHQTPKTPQQPLERSSYFVYALADEAVVMEEQAIQGTVTWKDNQYLQIQLTPGNVPAEGGAPSGYLVDVYTGTRMAE